MKVLVIPEHFQHDQHVLKPILKRLLDRTGVKARLEVCTDPLLGSVEVALNWSKLSEVLDLYRHRIDVFLLIVDRDGKPGRQDQLRRLEQQATDLLGEGRLLIAENAWQEIEVWVLAGMGDLPKDWAWTAIRDEPHPKEAYYEPYARIRGLHLSRSSGREILAREAASSYDRVRQLCPELKDLEDRIRALSGDQEARKAGFTPLPT